MAHKVYRTRFPVRKLNRKKDIKKRRLHHLPQPRAAGRGQGGGISRRKI